MSQTENSWIDWTGGECPVDPETRVQVQYEHETREGAESYNALIASYLPWARVRSGKTARIAAYRVVPA